jgi:hypothetical protein
MPQNCPGASELSRHLCVKDWRLSGTSPLANGDSNIIEITGVDRRMRCLDRCCTRCRQTSGTKLTSVGSRCERGFWPGADVRQLGSPTLVPVVCASIEFEARTAWLRGLIHHLRRRPMDDFMERVNTVIADMALFASNHASSRKRLGS